MITEIEVEVPPVEAKKDELFDYTKCKEHTDRLVHYWHSTGEDAVFHQVENNRAARAAVADVERMRAAAKLDPNHTYVGVRLIDGNIVNQMPSHLMYLKQSRRLGVFVPTDSRLVATMIDEVTNLESEFTRVMSYSGWEEPFIKVLDGSSLHGRDWLEVLHDESKPGHCAINHVGVEYLLHDPNVADLESSRVVMRSYSITLVDLQRMSLAYGFNEEAVKKLAEKLQTEYARDVRVIPAESRLYIYRVFFKDDAGRVYEAWMCKDSDDWLREPQAWYNGIQRKSEELATSAEAGQMDVAPQVSYEDIHQTQYPFFAKLHRITEDPVILRTRGRGFLDFYKQDASSATLTAFVNGCLDASRTQWAPTQGGTEGSEPKQLTNVARDGAVWDQPMEAFHSPYPDAALLQAVDKIGILNQAETAQVNWAVNNRQDSRKTATEVQTSAKQQTALSGVEVLMFSLTLSRVLNYAWQIVRSAAQNGMIKFMPDASGVNNERALSFEYQIKPAGDIDWIERQENVSRMQEDWPVVQSTPMRDMFLEDYVRMRYPQSAEKYIAVLRQGALAPQLAESLQRTMAVAQAALTDPQTKQLKPEYAEQQPQLMQLAQQNMQLIQQAQAAQGTQPTQNQTRSELP